MATKSWGVPGDVKKPVNASQQPKGTIFGAYKAAKSVPMKTKKKMSKALSRNYS